MLCLAFALTETKVDIERDYYQNEAGFQRWVKRKAEESAKIHGLTEYIKEGEFFMENEYLMVLDLGTRYSDKETLKDSMSKSSANIQAALEGDRPAVAVNHSLNKYQKCSKGLQKLFTSYNRSAPCTQEKQGW